MMMAASSAKYRLPFALPRNMLRRPIARHRLKSSHSILAVVSGFCNQGSFQFLFVTPCNVLFPKQPWNRYRRGKHRFQTRNSSSVDFVGLHFFLTVWWGFRRLRQGTWPKWPGTTMAVRSWRRACPMGRSAKFVTGVNMWVCMVWLKHICP